MRQELVAGLEARAKQMECCLEGNQCPLCSTSLLHNRHTIEDCLKDYAQQLMDMDQQAFPRNEVTWKIYEGDIEVTLVWNKPSSGLQKCGLCNRRRPLHYPKECLTISPVHHPCLFCGKEEPDHIPENCPTEGDLSQAKDVTELFHQRIKFQQALLYQKICYICRETDITNGHVAKCLASKIVSIEEGWAPPQVRMDTVVGSGLPKCCYCSQERPLHYPGDCNWALYNAAWPDHHAWFAGLIAMFQKNVQWQGLQ